ncbi:hypothetical protein CAEBREN_09611 [Caenorhabditis brenneri]|uniref:COMM domain-containing protein n=1 Tax=Caenorhabditis brenneri TaxID=135651 RepID=G0MAS9_CAEBE|nr:hypothetical protein CAEBREN_09611 [Caenorhabditis brenneri]
MDYFVVATCTELGLSQLLALDFPSVEHMTFIEWVMGQKNTSVALENKSEETKEFEANGLNGMVSAVDFFNKLKTVIERGSYRSASIRMDVQVSTRVSSNAPDCKLNMLLKTTDWEKSLDLSSATCDKLLDELENARTFLRQNKLAMKEQVE